MVIKAPLWEMLLDTNQCYPGCGCEADVFEQDLKPISRWLRSAGTPQGEVALAQLDALLASADSIDQDELSYQTNMAFTSIEDVAAWLREWRRLLYTCLHSQSSTQT